eukprot:11029428-Alexandrium_andersonii.AAC.1
MPLVSVPLHPHDPFRPGPPLALQLFQESPKVPIVPEPPRPPTELKPSRKHGLEATHDTCIVQMCDRLTSQHVSHAHTRKLSPGRPRPLAIQPGREHEAIPSLPRPHEVGHLSHEHVL